VIPEQSIAVLPQDKPFPQVVKVEETPVLIGVLEIVAVLVPDAKSPVICKIIPELLVVGALVGQLGVGGDEGIVKSDEVPPDAEGRIFNVVIKDLTTVHCPSTSSSEPFPTDHFDDSCFQRTTKKRNTIEAIGTNFIICKFKKIQNK
jgi:hypothetical protein